MKDEVIALRIALVELMKEFARICDENCKTPQLNKAYQDAEVLINGHPRS